MANQADWYSAFGGYSPFGKPASSGTTEQMLVPGKRYYNAAGNFATFAAGTPMSMAGGFIYDAPPAGSQFSNVPAVPQQSTAPGGVSANGTIGENTRLQQYTQPTAVPLAAGQQEMITTVRNLLSGQQGNLKQLLSGTPNWGQFESGIAEPMRQSLQNTVQPKVNEAYSGSGTGSSFFSGARQNEQQNQSNALQSELAKLRYQEQQGATADSLTAMGQLTGLNSILSMETANDVNNMATAIATHYKNQGLTAEQAGLDLSKYLADLTAQNQAFTQNAQTQKQNTLSELLANQSQQLSSVNQRGSSGQGGVSTQVVAPNNWGMTNEDANIASFFAKSNSDNAVKNRQSAAALNDSNKGWWNS